VFDGWNSCNQLMSVFFTTNMPNLTQPPPSHSRHQVYVDPGVPKKARRESIPPGLAKIKVLGGLAPAAQDDQPEGQNAGKERVGAGLGNRRNGHGVNVAGSGCIHTLKLNVENIVGI
jgi:hypothetical protein